MLRTIMAAMVIVTAGFAGVWSLQQSDAQDRPRPPQPEPRHEVPPGMHEPRMMQMPPAPGTWEVIKLEKAAILLNTATGQTFQLVEGKEGLHWKPIPRPDAREHDGRGDAPRDKPAPDKLELERAEKLRKHIEELERDLERARAELKGAGGDRPDAKKPDAKKPDEPNINELEKLLKNAEERILDLKERIEETDNEDRRAKLKEELKALSQKADEVRARIKKARGK